MAEIGHPLRTRASSSSRATSPVNLPALTSDFQRLQARVFSEFPNFTRITAEFRDTKEACKALFAQNKELFSKILHLTSALKASDNATSAFQAKSENVDLQEKMRAYGDLIVKLSNENDYYSRHIQNLLGQLHVLKGEKKHLHPKLKAAELQEQIIIKDEELKQLHIQLQTRGKVSLDAKNCLAKLETLQSRLNSELAEKELYRHSQQDFLSHMHTQAKSIEKLLTEVSPVSPVEGEIARLRQEAEDYKSLNSELTLQLEFSRKQLLKSTVSKKPEAVLTAKQRGLLEQVNDLFELNEMQKAADRWKELEYADLPQEPMERSSQLLREVLNIRDADISRLDRELKKCTTHEGTEDSLLAQIREKDEEIDVLKNTLLAGSGSFPRSDSLKSKLRLVTQELHLREEELKAVLQERTESNPNETAETFLQTIERKDQEIGVLLDELVELRKGQEPSDELRAVISEKNAKLLRLETELGLFRGSPETFPKSIEEVLLALIGKGKEGENLTDFVSETTAEIQRIALKSVSKRIVEEAESNARKETEEQIKAANGQIEALEAALKRLRTILDEEKKAQLTSLRLFSTGKPSSTTEELRLETLSPTIIPEESPPDALKTSESNALRTALESAKLQLADLNRKLYLSQSEAMKSNQELERLRRESLSKSEVSGLKETSQLSQVSEKVTKEQYGRIKELQEEGSKLQERIYDLDFERKSKEIEMQRRIDEKDSLISSVKADLVRLENEANRLKEEEKQRTEELESLRKSKNEQMGKFQSMSEELDDRKQELSRIYQQLDAAFTELKTVKESSEEEVSALKSANEHLADLESAAKRESAEILKISLEKDDQISDLSEQVNALTSELQHQTDMPMIDLEEAVIALIHELQASPVYGQALQHLPLDDMSQDSLLTAIKTASAILQNPPKSESSPALTRFEEVLTRAQSLLQDLDRFREDEKARILQENLSLEKQLLTVNFTANLQESKPKNPDEITKWAIGKWQEAEQGIVRLRTEVAELEQRLKRSKTEPATVPVSLEIQALQELLARSKQQIADLQETGDSRRRQRKQEENKQIEGLKIDLKAAEVDKMELEQALSRLKDEAEYTEAQLKRCVADSETKETAWKQALARLKDLVKARFDLEKQPVVLLDPYVNPLAFIETLSNEFQDLNKRRVGDREKVAKVLTDWQEAKQVWNEREDHFRADLEAANSKKTALETSIQTLQSHLQKLRQESDLAQEAHSRLEAELAILRERQNEDGLKDAFEKGKTVGFAEAKRVEKSELEGENKKLQGLLKEYKDSLEDIKRKWKEAQDRLSAGTRLSAEMTTQVQSLTQELETEHEERVKLAEDLQGKTEFFERLLTEVENTKQFYHK